MTDQAFGGAAAATRACTPHQHIQADRAQTPPSFECPAAHDLCNNSGVSAVNSKVLFLSRVISRPFASLYVCINRCWMRGRSLKGECPFPCRAGFLFFFFFFLFLFCAVILVQLVVCCRRCLVRRRTLSFPFVRTRSPKGSPHILALGSSRGRKSSPQSTTALCDRESVLCFYFLSHFPQLPVKGVL